MCGIAGAVSLNGGHAVDPATLRRALAVLRHRGPEAAGMWMSDVAALGHARLSIIDLVGGLQPMANEDESVWVVVNGEVFNHLELRAELCDRGHVFRSRSDSEVIVHLYEEMGAGLLERLNGQYALAVWDVRRGELLLARDRLGVRPLFFTVTAGRLLFASEIKALLVDDRVSRRPNLKALDDVFTFWSTLPGTTMFDGIDEVPAGHYLTARLGVPEPTITQYWDIRFDRVEHDMHADEAASGLRDLLVDATRLRLRADVPVGAYLSGGLDSSAIAAIVRAYTPNSLQTFSVAFEDEAFDERRYQERMARALGTDHHVLECRGSDIAEVFPDVVWSTEAPVLRTAPAPMFLLSALVRRHGLKVVLTGEGADELLAGYDIFKEQAVRRFWARDPDSRLRPKLLGRLYDWVPDLNKASTTAHLEMFFRQSLEQTDDVAYSHLVRWANASRLKRLFSPEVRAELADHDSRLELDRLLAPDVAEWDPLSRAQYLEAKLFLSQYLLSSQGDRMAMAHSVEGRFPFLDYRVVEFATRIPPRLRMVGFDEKRVLKQCVSDVLPAEITRRRKRPYRAPVAGVFCEEGSPDYVRDLLSREAVASAGLFNPDAVVRLYEKCRASSRLSESDSMALTGVLSTQLWHHSFISSFRHEDVPQRNDVVTLGQLPVAQDRTNESHLRKGILTDA